MVENKELTYSTNAAPQYESRKIENRKKKRFGRKVEETFFYIIIKGSGKAAVILWIRSFIFGIIH